MEKAIDSVLSRFRAALDQAYGSRIERVVLFGSRARGDARPDSDYDVAVFLKDLDNYLRKARDDLNDARKIAAIGLAKVAARAAYYAAFHAVEAFVVERTGKIAKTHSGLRAEFGRLARGVPEI